MSSVMINRCFPSREHIFKGGDCEHTPPAAHWSLLLCDLKKKNTPIPDTSGFSSSSVLLIQPLSSSSPRSCLRNGVNPKEPSGTNNMFHHLLFLINRTCCSIAPESEKQWVLPPRIAFFTHVRFFLVPSTLIFSLLPLM